MIHSLDFLLRCALGYFENKGFLSEAQIFRWHKTVQKYVYTLPHGEWHGNDAIGAGYSVQAADKVGQVVQHGQIVLHDNDEPCKDK